MASSLWVGSDVDLPTLHQCRSADRLEFRLTCLHNKKPDDYVGRNNNFDITESKSFEDISEIDRNSRKSRSGTWP